MKKKWSTETPSVNASHVMGHMEQWIKPGAKVLDVGCGSAEVAFFMEKKGYRFFNIDIGDFRAYNTQHFALYDGQKIDLPDSSVDLVSINFVLHHVPNEKKEFLLSEAMRVTSKYVFILEDTPRNFLDRMISNFHGWYFRRSINSTASYGFYSQENWEKLFTRLNYIIAKSERLSRFCRNKKEPYARSLFVLEKPEAVKEKKKPGAAAKPKKKAKPGAAAKSKAKAKSVAKVKSRPKAKTGAKTKKK